MDIFTFQLLVLAGVSIIFGIIGRRIALSRGKNGAIGLLIGFLLGILVMFFQYAS